jgi:transcription elongation factor GreA
MDAWDGLVSAAELDQGMYLIRGDEEPEDALALAYGLELGSHRFYQDLAGRVSDPEARDLFRTLAEVEVVPGTNELHTEVSLGCHVVIRDTEGEQEEYVIVDHAEADPRLGRISQTSPVGQALMGHKAKDKVSVDTPAGTRLLTIVEVR